MLFLMVIMYGGLIFVFEMDSDMFPNTATSMWWALITMTATSILLIYSLKTVLEFDMVLQHGV